MIDIHCHVAGYLSEYGKTEDLFKRLKTAQVGVIMNGLGLNNSRETIKLASPQEKRWAAVGIPYGNKINNLSLAKARLENMASLPGVVAIGEIGLDYGEALMPVANSHQKILFESQLQVAQKFDLPVIIHNRKADGDVLELVEKYGVRGVLHCFTQGEDFAKKAIKLGLYLSFGGMITFKKNEELREVLKQVPKERLLLETDSPYLAPEPIRGRVNSPENVKIVANTAASSLGITYEEIEKLTEDNARRLFKLIL